MCQQKYCSTYSEDNKNPLPNDCTCQTDSRNTEDNPFICKAGYYCLNPSNTPDIPYTGCQTSEDHLKKNCSEYSETNTTPIDEECFCGINSDGEPNLCPIGKYCVDSICKNINCPEGQIIDPSDHSKCIKKEILYARDEEPPIKSFIDDIKDKLKSTFDDLQNKF